jgi:hypothetical protein
VVRLLRPSSRESLEGYAIGVLGALSFSAAATITRLAPQFATGLVARNRSLSGLLVEAGIRGVTVPLIAAAAGGLLGAALWFTRPPSKKHQRRGAVRVTLVLVMVALLLCYSALGLIDVAQVSQWVQLTVHVLFALVALLVLRVGMHLALLHEAHDEIHAEQPVLCVHCGHVVPDMAFCPACGVAMRASSRTSRETRRGSRPVRGEPEAPAP